VTTLDVDVVAVWVDLVGDMTEVCTFFCAPLYAGRKARNQALRAING
jgi:predicted site-specific integrase-resolvase